ncbi:MAG: hypothetical protein LH649_14795 [Pseudanabaena sp. CAN_BIN31]|nr:hypothetical protein [Pseudanabaena sp. CAN_BIN31]
MSAPRHRHLNLISSRTNSPRQTSPFGIRPRIADRFSQLLHEIEAFLLACTYEEMCSFWDAIANLRQYLEKDLERAANCSEVPKFLNSRRKQRDFCRILEVLADLPSPKLRLSHHLPKRSNDRRHPNRHLFVHPHLSIQR